MSINLFNYTFYQKQIHVFFVAHHTLWTPSILFFFFCTVHSTLTFGKGWNIYLYKIHSNLKGSQYFTYVWWCSTFKCKILSQKLTRCYTVSVLGRDEGYTVKYSPEGVPEGEARENSWRQRAIFDRISRVKYIINRPGVAGAVLQSPPWSIISLTHSLSDGLWKYIQGTVNPKP